MSETPSNTPENAYETPPSLAGSRRTANRPRRALIGLGIGAAVIGVIQWFAGDTDFQFAFMGCFVVGLFTSVYVLWQLQWLSASQGKGWLVPSVTVAAIALFAVAFEFRGFNGEMVPQFHWRFGEPKPELVTTVTPEETAELDADSEEGQQDPSGEEQAETLVTQTLSDWPQFLGRHRNGIIDQRRFAIPTSVSDVEIVWDHGIGDGWSSFAVQEPYAITLEQRDEAECVTAYRIKDGTMAWIRQHEASHFQAMGGGGPRTTPLIDGDRVYAQGSTGVVWCLDLGSGDVIWSVDLLEKAGWSQSESEVAIAWGRSGSPLLVDDMCVVPFGGPESAAKTGRSLIALNADSGEVLWTAGEDQISYASPQLLTFDGSRQIVIVNESTITGHALTDGAVQWSIQWPGSSNGQANCAAVVPAGPNRFVVGKGYGGGSALITVERTATGFEAKDVWASSQLLKTKFNHSLVVGGIAYAVSNGILQAVDLEDQKRLWQQSRRERSEQGQAILVEDTLVVQNEAGDVLFVEATPDDYRELLRLPALTSKTWNIPTVSGRYLLVRNGRRAICFRLPPRD